MTTIPVLDLNDDRHIGSVVMWPTVCVGKYIRPYIVLKILK
jgi:hypothetical protein